MDSELMWRSNLDRRSSAVGAAGLTAVAADSSYAVVLLKLSQRMQQRPSAPQDDG